MWCYNIPRWCYNIASILSREVLQLAALQNVNNPAIQRSLEGRKRQNENQIKVHLTRTHNMTMEEYAAKFVHADSKMEDAVPAHATNEDIKVPKNVMW